MHYHRSFVKDHKNDTLQSKSGKLILQSTSFIKVAIFWCITLKLGSLQNIERVIPYQRVTVSVLTSFCTKGAIVIPLSAKDNRKLG